PPPAQPCSRPANSARGCYIGNPSKAQGVERSWTPSMRSVLLATLLLPVAVGAGACTASGDEVAPPSDQFFYPTGAAVALDDSVLFVANANGELRWDSGAIDVVDLA